MKHKLSKPDKYKNKTGYFSQGLVNDRPCLHTFLCQDKKVCGVWGKAPENNKQN